MKEKEKRKRDDWDYVTTFWLVPLFVMNVFLIMFVTNFVSHKYFEGKIWMDD
jgi:hypothetical protein